MAGRRYYAKLARDYRAAGFGGWLASLAFAAGCWLRDRREGKEGRTWTRRS